MTILEKIAATIHYQLNKIPEDKAKKHRRASSIIGGVSGGILGAVGGREIAHETGRIATPGKVKKYMAVGGAIGAAGAGYLSHRNAKKRIEKYNKNVDSIEAIERKGGKVMAIQKKSNLYIDKIAELLEKKSATYSVKDQAGSKYYGYGKHIQMDAKEYREYLKDQAGYADKNMGAKPLVGAAVGGGLGVAAGKYVGKRMGAPKTRMVAYGLMGALAGTGTVLNHINNKAHRSAVRDRVTKDLKSTKDERDVMDIHGSTYKKK